MTDTDLMERARELYEVLFRVGKHRLGRVPGDPEALILQALAAAEQRGAERAEELEALFDLTHAADMRAVAIWREANPGNDLVLPDRVDLVMWLMERLDEAADALEPFARFLPTVEGFVERAAATPGASPIMPAVKDFRLKHFRAAAAVLAAIRNRTTLSERAAADNAVIDAIEKD